MSVLSYSGYISSKEEKTGDEPDAAEIFTITKDVPIVDQRVKEKWPCHGPVYWPDYEYRTAMTTYMNMLGELGLSRKIDLCWIKKIIVYFISYKFLSLLMRITGLN